VLISYNEHVGKAPYNIGLSIRQMWVIDIMLLLYPSPNVEGVTVLTRWLKHLTPVQRGTSFDSSCFFGTAQCLMS